MFQDYEYLIVSNLLLAFQFGFLAGLSVSDHLLLVSVHMDPGNDVDVLYFDYVRHLMYGGVTAYHKLLLTASMW